MTEQLAAMKQAAEDVSKAYDLIAWGHTERAAEILKGARTTLRTAIEQAERQQALDKKAENARELGLDYEPVQEPFVWLEDDKCNKYPMSEENKGPLLKRAEEAFESAKKREWKEN